MDPELTSKLKINGWLRDLTFPKFLFTMIVFTVLFWKSTTDHMNNDSVHLNSIKEQATMQYLIENDLTHGAQISLINLRNDINALKVLLAQYEKDGKLQTPEEKKKMIRDVIEEYEHDKKK